MATTPTLDKSTMDIENDQIKTVRLTVDVLIPGGVAADKRTVHVWAAFPKGVLQLEATAQALVRKVGSGADTPVTIAPWEAVEGATTRIVKGSVSVGDATQQATLKGWVEFRISNPGWSTNQQGDFQVTFNVDVTSPQAG